MVGGPSPQEAQADAAQSQSFRAAEFRTRAELRDRLRSATTLLELAVDEHVPSELKHRFRLDR